jgi:hypothetical protein
MMQATRWFFLGAWLPLAVLTLVSLCVHVLLRHKVMAHLVLIAAWMVAVALDSQLVRAPWARLGLDLAHARAAAGLEPLATHDVLHWVASGVAAATIAIERWPRGVQWQPPASTVARVGLCIAALTAPIVTGVIVSR